MAKFKVSQTVICELQTWYVIDAPTHIEALQVVAKNNTPTCVNGVDYEITSDNQITYTKVEELDDGL